MSEYDEHELVLISKIPERPTIDDLTRIMDQTNHNLLVLSGLIRSTVDIMSMTTTLIEGKFGCEIKRFTEE